MKLFAIITAGLMAAGGGIYFYSTSPCSKSQCATSAPVAKTGGCCSTHDDSALSDPNCSGTPTVHSCCAVKDESFIATAAFSTAVNVSAVAKPVVVETCCESCIVTPTLNVTIAAKSIASAK